MPLLNEPDMDTHSIQGSNYGFSAKRIGDLGASEYTLVGITADVSGSVSPFRDEIEMCIKEIVSSCKHSPRADNLMLRLSIFDNDVTEVHGFRPLSECDVDKYTGAIQIGGITALYDAATNLIDSVARYGKDLTDNDFDCNGIVFVVTDGRDNASTFTPNKVKEALGEVITGEALESMVSVLIGVNIQDAVVSQYLQDFHQDAGFTQYVELGNADEKTLAKLADFVSQSISAQSQSLGTGGPSQSLTF